jgi:hypothetical protein
MGDVEPRSGVTRGSELTNLNRHAHRSPTTPMRLIRTHVRHTSSPSRYQQPHNDIVKQEE